MEKYKNLIEELKFYKESKTYVVINSQLEGEITGMNKQGYVGLIDSDNKEHAIHIRNIRTITN